MPVLSICIPTYNRCEYLMNNLQHICEHQEYDFEIIISDNASTDDTYKRVTEYIKNNNIDKIKYFRNRENIGPDANFKRVLSLGQGKYSLLLGDDDYLNDDFFEKVLPFLKKNEFSFVALSSKEMMIRIAKAANRVIAGDYLGKPVILTFGVPSINVGFA